MHIRRTPRGCSHPKAIETLKRLNRPYMVALPLARGGSTIQALCSGTGTKIRQNIRCLLGFLLEGSMDQKSMEGTHCKGHPLRRRLSDNGGVA